MCVIRRHFLAAVVDPTVSPRTILFRWKSFLDHVDHTEFRCMHVSVGVVRPHRQPLTYSHLRSDSLVSGGVALHSDAC